MSAATRAADALYVARARRHGCRAGLARIIIAACREFGLPISLGFALFECESAFRKVWGHDPAPNGGTDALMGRPVTKRNYLAYKRRRGPSGAGGRQGAGEGQLTWHATQDLADRMGGCWTARGNVRCAVMTLAARIRENGYVVGIQRYNGSGPAAVAYSRKVRGAADRWHDWLAGKG